MIEELLKKMKPDIKNIYNLKSYGYQEKIYISLHCLDRLKFCSKMGVISILKSFRT